MSSVALLTWSSDSSARLDEMEAVHVRLTGTNRGRRWGTTQLNLSLFTALTSQFQAYCRSLHDEAVEVHVAAANPTQEGVLRVLLTEGRKLDSGNARSSTLGNDFNRLGFQFVPALKAQGPLTERRLTLLDELTDIPQRHRPRQPSADRNARRGCRDHADQVLVQAVQELSRRARQHHGWSGCRAARVAAWSTSTMVKHVSVPTGLAPGTTVSFPWGLDEMRGIVVEVYGPPGRPHVLIQLTPELSGDIVDEPTTVSYPLDAITVLIT